LFRPDYLPNRFSGLLEFLFLLGLSGLVYYNSQYPLLDEIQKQAENVKLKTEWLGIHAQLKKTSPATHRP